MAWRGRGPPDHPDGPDIDLVSEQTTEPQVVVGLDHPGPEFLLVVILDRLNNQGA